MSGKGRKRIAVLVLVLIAPVVAFAAYLHASGFFAADACLDRGGSYHYDRSVCSFATNYTGDVPPLWPF